MISRTEYDYSKDVGYELGLRAMDICTGCGPGAMKGPMKGADGKMIQPTNKKFHLEFCTLAHWNKNGEILEERLFYDLVGMMKQIGLS